jgi:hypothetical protein
MPEETANVIVAPASALLLMSVNHTAGGTGTAAPTPAL